MSGENEVSTCLHIMCLLWDARSKPLLTVQLSLLLQLFRYTLSVFLCKWTQAWGRSSAAESRYGFGMDMHGSMKKTTTQLQFSILQGRCSENEGFVDVVDSLLISFCISRSTRIFLDFTVPLSLPHWDQYPQLLPLTAAQELVRVKQAAPQTKSTSAATCNLSAVPQENPNITIMHQPWYPLVI